MKYIIEGYGDFDLNKEILNYKNNNEEDVCLLTNEPLTYNHITLECNHKFNYKPLLEQLRIIKQTKNYFNKNRLKIDEISCPYCRNIQNKILPYISIEEVNKIRGINYPTKYCMEYKICSEKNCKNNAFECEHGVLCNTHYKKYQEKEMIKLYEKEINIYKKKKCKELKEILKEQNKKISGNKIELILRIIGIN